MSVFFGKLLGEHVTQFLILRSVRWVALLRHVDTCEKNAGRLACFYVWCRALRNRILKTAHVIGTPPPNSLRRRQSLHQGRRQRSGLQSSVHALQRQEGVPGRSIHTLYKNQMRKPLDLRDSSSGFQCMGDFEAEASGS